MDVKGQFIHGEFVTDNPAQRQPIIEPATGETIGELGFANDKQIEAAIDSASQAFPGWSQTSANKRAQILYRFKYLLEKNQSKIAQAVTREHGKTIEDAKGSVARGLEVVEHNCGIANMLSGQFSSNVASNIDCMTFRQPLGVCAGISPFNFPVMVPLWMMMPAIACGNTFILKPSEQVPTAPLMLMELLKEAGLPEGVVNLVQGDKHSVDILTSDSRIQAVTAVASTPVAKAIYERGITHGKRAHTFGGAKNHCLVAPDANIEQTAKAISGAAFGAAGERCMALSVAVVVGDEMADKLVQVIKADCAKLRVGNGLEADTDIGPLISQAHWQRVNNYIGLGVEEGANLVFDGREQQHSCGFYLGPSIFDNVNSNMRIYQEEIFGPVLCIIRVKSFAEGVELINQHQYGNGTAIFTHDGYLARRYMNEVQAGMVGINIPIPVPVAQHPFGGWKHSVFGDTNMHGHESVHFYTKLKTVTSRWPKDEAHLQNAYVMPTH